MALTLTLITGASRGIGAEIASQLAAEIDNNHMMLLLARSQHDLDAVAHKINNKNPNVAIHTLRADLSEWNADMAHAVENKLTSIVGEGNLEKLFVFHNAGTVGRVDQIASSLSDLGEWLTYLHTNFFSMVALNNLILKHFATTMPSTTIVNITSLCAIKAFRSMTEYSCGKAIREAFFRGLAVERPDVKVLSYSPGPVDTGMHAEIAEKSCDESTRSTFAQRAVGPPTEIHREMLTCTQTVTKLMKVLRENTFTSGDRIDYFDI